METYAEKIILFIFLMFDITCIAWRVVFVAYQLYSTGYCQSLDPNPLQCKTASTATSHITLK